MSPLDSPDGAHTSFSFPKNKSTGNLLLQQSDNATVDRGRNRYSFDAGSAQEINNLKR